MSITDELRGIIPEIDFATNRDRLRAIADLIDMKHDLGRGTCKDVATEGEWFKCSECGFGIDDWFTSIEYPDDPSYCPNCGRKVVSE